MSTVIRRGDARRTTTPNATMTTFASPTQGASRQALWRVEMAPGAVGPDHTMAGEQVWSVVAGGASVEVAGERHDLTPGDTLVLPGGEPRRVHADSTLGLEAVVTGVGDDVASGPGREPVVPPWIA
ncbi:cupin domain-containing protein [Actinomycetospora sp. C-140]